MGTRGALRKGPCKSVTKDEKCRWINNLKDPGLLEMVSDLGSAAGQPGLQALFLIRALSGDNWCLWVALKGSASVFPMGLLVPCPQEPLLCSPSMRKVTGRSPSDAGSGGGEHGVDLRKRCVQVLTLPLKLCIWGQIIQSYRISLAVPPLQGHFESSLGLCMYCAQHT